jgi:hypothetical protein
MMQTPRRSAGGWIADHVFLLAAIVFMLVNGVQLVLTKPASSEWDQVFILSANKLIHGGDIYSIPHLKGTIENTAPEIVFQITHPYTYPPFHSLLAVPFTPLPHVLSRIGFFLVQAVSLSVLWILSWKLSGGRPLDRQSWKTAEPIICLLGLIAGMRYIQGTFGHQQSDILIDALLVAGCYAWKNRRDFLAATAWAFAAAFKGPPLLMAPYLAWRGRWLPALWTVILAVGLNLIPDAIHRPSEGIWLTQWYTRMIKPMNGQIGAWYVDVVINQSIAGAAHRYFTTTWHITGGKFGVTLGKHFLSDHAQKLIVYGVDAGLLLAGAFAMRRPFRRPADGQTAVLECAFMFILMLLLSPMSHLTHFGILMFPGFIVARAAIRRENLVATAAIVFVLIDIGLLDRFIFYPPLGDIAAWLGNVMWGAVALGIACFWLLLKQAKPLHAKISPPSPHLNVER